MKVLGVILAGPSVASPSLASPFRPPPLMFHFLVLYSVSLTLASQSAVLLWGYDFRCGLHAPHFVSSRNDSFASLVLVLPCHSVMFRFIFTSSPFLFFKFILRIFVLFMCVTHLGLLSGWLSSTLATREIETWQFSVVHFLTGNIKKSYCPHEVAVVQLSTNSWK